MARLLLVRHGEIESMNPPRYWGHTNVRLCAEGMRQAQKLCRRLANETITAIYSSDLRRALDTAAIIAVPHQVPVVPCAELREIDFGRCEGMTFDEIKRSYPQAERVLAGLDLELDFPGGESFRALAERVDRFATRLSNHSPDDTILLVAHGGSLRTLVCRMISLDLSCWWQLRIDPASVTVLETYPEGTVLSLLNDLSHLTSVSSGLESGE